jgi:hypothetical protein
MLHSEASVLRSYECLEFSKVGMDYVSVYMLLEGWPMASEGTTRDLETIVIG